MLRLKRAGAPGAPGRKHGLKVEALFLGALLLTASAVVEAQSGKIGPAALANYDNKYEVYGGLNFMNFQAGQNLPKRMNLGGGELSLTYWVTSRLGAVVEYRGEAGTTPVNPSPASFRPSRQLVYMNMGLVGIQYRGPKNHYAAIDYHALVGASDGVFDGPSNFDVGLYTNRAKPVGAFGGSLDYNRSKNLAVRISPDLIVEHFGTEYREFFAISAGVIYRFGKR